jgi:hypothetical protein
MQVSHTSGLPVTTALKQTLLAVPGCAARDVDFFVDGASNAWHGPPVSFADMRASGTLPKFHTAGKGEDYCIVFVLVLVLMVEDKLEEARDAGCTRERREEIVRSMDRVKVFLDGLQLSTAPRASVKQTVRNLVTLATRVVDVMARRAQRVGERLGAGGLDVLAEFRHFESMGCTALRAVAYLGVRKVPREGGRYVLVGGLGVCTWFTRLAEVAATQVMEVLLEFEPSIRRLQGPRYAMRVLHVGHLCLLLSQLWRKAEEGQREETGALFGFQDYWVPLKASASFSVEWERENGFGSRDFTALMAQGHTHKDWFRMGPRFLVAWWGLAGLGLSLTKEAVEYKPERVAEDLAVGILEDCVSRMGLAVEYLSRILPNGEPCVRAAMLAARRALLDLCSSHEGMTRAVLPRKNHCSHSSGATCSLAFKDVWEDPRTHGPALSVAMDVVFTIERKGSNRRYGHPEQLRSGLEAKAMCMVSDLVSYGLGVDVAEALGKYVNVVNPEACVNCWGTSTRRQVTYVGLFRSALEDALSMKERWSKDREAWIHVVVRAGMMRARIMCRDKILVSHRGASKHVRVDVQL